MKQWPSRHNQLSPQAQDASQRRWGMTLIGASLVVGVSLTVSGCSLLPRQAAEAQTERQGNAADRPSAVEVGVARAERLEQPREYTGTTQPAREISLRSQVEGQLQQLSVDVGDRVTQGQAVAQVDDTILTAAVLSAEAELASRQSEVAQARTQVSDARTRVEQARLELQQAEADAARLEQLARQGAISLQQAEQARTAARTAAQVVRSAQEQVRNQQQSITAAQGRVLAQQGALAQARERRNFAVVTSPITGFVLEKISETGNLVQPGAEILKLGDFSRAKIAVQVSDLELGSIRLGQSVQVRLDAFPNRNFVGTVSRISPAANPTSRLIPVEVTVPNPGGQIGSGLLARVSFQPQGTAKVVVPQTALQRDRGGRQASGNGAAGSTNSASRPAPSPRASAAPSRSSNGSTDTARPTRGTIFVLAATNAEQPTVAARPVTLGRQADGKVEIVAGLKPGERYVLRSDRPLKSGQSVRLSVLSE